MPKPSLICGAREFLTHVFAHRARKTELFVASFRQGPPNDRAPQANGNLRNIPDGKHIYVRMKFKDGAIIEGWHDARQMRAWADGLPADVRQ